MVDLLGIYICAAIYSVGLLLLGHYVAVLFFLQVVVVPLLFRYSKALRRTIVFANFVQFPMFFDYDQPLQAGLKGARNLSVEFESKVDKCPVKIGIWHVLPETLYEKLKGHFEISVDKDELNKQLDHELANSDRPIVMYFHGNSNNRATPFRVKIYKIFQQMGLHTITFDYRGYGDSTKVRPTEAGVVEDSLVVYAWLLYTSRKLGKRPPIYVWGHSLGTGISSSMLGNLGELSKLYLDGVPLPLPNGLILEAPFNNIADEVANHPLARLVTWLPYFDSMFVSPFRLHVEQRFRSDENLKRVNELPVLIIHAKDDLVVPFILGDRLNRSLLAARENGGAAVIFHAYEIIQCLGHTNIYRALDLDMVFGEFITNNFSPVESSMALL